MNDIEMLDAQFKINDELRAVLKAIIAHEESALGAACKLSDVWQLAHGAIGDPVKLVVLK